MFSVRKYGLKLSSHVRTLYCDHRDIDIEGRLKSLKNQIGRCRQATYHESVLQLSESVLLGVQSVLLGGPESTPVADEHILSSPQR